MTGPMATDPKIDDLGRSRVTTIQTVGFPLTQDFEWWLRSTNRMVLNHIMGQARRSIIEDVERREADETRDNSDPFGRTIRAFAPGFLVPSSDVEGAALASDIDYSVLAEELAGRVLSRYIKTSGWETRAAGIAEALLSHPRQLYYGPPEAFGPEALLVEGRVRDPSSGQWVRATRVVNSPVYDPDGYNLDNYDTSGWVDLYPKQRLDLLGYPVSLPPYFEGLPDLLTPTAVPEDIPDDHAVTGLPHWLKPGTGSLILHPNDYYLIETWEEDYGAGPDRAVQRVLHRANQAIPAPSWIGPTESHEEVQLFFMEDAPISPGKARVGRTFTEHGPISPAPSRPARETLRSRGFQITISTEGVSPSAVTDPATVISAVTEPPPSTFSKTRGRVRERKVRPHKKMMGVLWWAMNIVTESVDAVTQFWKALPPENRTGMVRRVNHRTGEVYYKRIFYPTPQEMARDLYRGWNRVDFNKALWNVTVNQIQDHVIGRTNMQITKGFRPHYERSRSLVGVTAGPAL